MRALSGPVVQQTCFISGEGRPHRALHSCGESRAARGRQTALHLVIRGGITISFVWELFGEEREDKAGRCLPSTLQAGPQPASTATQPRPRSRWQTSISARGGFLLFHWPRSAGHFNHTCFSVGGQWICLWAPRRTGSHVGWCVTSTPNTTAGNYSVPYG